MRKKSLMEFVDEYIEAATIHGACLLNGDYKQGNKAFDKAEKIFKLSISSPDKEKFYASVLSSTKDINTLSKASAHMLKLNINPKYARKTLEKIVKDKEAHPLLRSNARIFLEEWDNGNIKPVVN